MKKALSALSAIVIMFSMLPVLGVNAFAVKNYAQGFDGDSGNSRLVDNANIFSAENEASLTEEIQKYSAELEMNIYIYVSGTYRTDSQTEIFADDTYDETFGEDTDGVFYYLDLSGKQPAYDYISTSGKAVLIYEDVRESIFSYLDNYLPASGEAIYEDDIYDAVSGFLSCLNTYSSHDSTALEYYHDKSSGKYFYYKGGELVVSRSKPLAIWLNIALVSVLIGAVIALISYFITKSRYKFKASTNPDVYISRNESVFTNKSDVLIRTYVTKHKIESSSGGSHGGGGHSHSGGHGGGGHHR